MTEVVDIRGLVHSRTNRAILFSDDGGQENAVWLPLSQVEVEMHGRGIATVTMPEWLAVKEGFV